MLIVNHNVSWNNHLNMFLLYTCECTSLNKEQPTQKQQQQVREINVKKSNNNGYCYLRVL